MSKKSLSDFFNRLDNPKNYTEEEQEIHDMGYEAGYEIGYERAKNEAVQVLSSIETIFKLYKDS